MFRPRHGSTGRALSRERVRPPEKPKKKRSKSRSKSPAPALARSLGKFGSRLARSVSPGQNAIGASSDRVRREKSKTDRLRKSLSPASSRSSTPSRTGSSRTSGSRTGSSRSRSPKSVSSGGSGSRRDGSRKKSRTRGRSSSRRKSRSGSNKKERDSSRSRRKSKRRSQDGCDQASEVTGRIDNTNSDLPRLKNEPHDYRDGLTYDQYGQPQYADGLGPLVSADDRAKENLPGNALNSRRADDPWLERQHQAPTQLPQVDPNWQDFVNKSPAPETTAPSRLGSSYGSDEGNWNYGRQPVKFERRASSDKASDAKNKNAQLQASNHGSMAAGSMAAGSMAWSLFTSRKSVGSGLPGQGKNMKWGANAAEALPTCLEIVTPPVVPQTSKRYAEFAPNDEKGPASPAAVQPIEDPSVAPQVTPQEVQHYKRRMKDIMSTPVPHQPPAVASGLKRALSRSITQQREVETFVTTPVASTAPATRTQPSSSSPPVGFPALPLEVARGWKPKRSVIGMNGPVKGMGVLGSPDDARPDAMDVEYLPTHLSPAARSPGTFFDGDEHDDEEDEVNTLGRTEPQDHQQVDRSDGEVDAIDRALHQYHRSRSLGVKSLPPPPCSSTDQQSQSTSRPNSRGRAGRSIATAPPAGKNRAEKRRAVTPEPPPQQAGVDERLSSINARLSKINAEAGGNDVMLTDAKAVKSMLMNLRAWRNEMAKDENENGAAAGSSDNAGVIIPGPFASERDESRSRRTNRTGQSGSTATGSARYPAPPPPPPRPLASPGRRGSATFTRRLSGVDIRAAHDTSEVSTMSGSYTTFSRSKSSGSRSRSTGSRSQSLSAFRGRAHRRVSWKEEVMGCEIDENTVSLPGSSVASSRMPPPLRSLRKAKRALRDVRQYIDAASPHNKAGQQKGAAPSIEQYVEYCSTAPSSRDQCAPPPKVDKTRSGSTVFSDANNTISTCTLTGTKSSGSSSATWSRSEGRMSQSRSDASSQSIFGQPGQSLFQQRRSSAPTVRSTPTANAATKASKISPESFHSMYVRSNSNGCSRHREHKSDWQVEGDDLKIKLRLPFATANLPHASQQESISSLSGTDSNSDPSVVKNTVFRARVASSYTPTARPIEAGGGPPDPVRNETELRDLTRLNKMLLQMSNVDTYSMAVGASPAGVAERSQSSSDSDGSGRNGPPRKLEVNFADCNVSDMTADDKLQFTIPASTEEVRDHLRLLRMRHPPPPPKARA